MTNSKLESVKIKNKKANWYYYTWVLILIVKEKLDMFSHRHEDDFVNIIYFIFIQKKILNISTSVFIVGPYKKIKYKNKI
jgi:hypothetical protein